MNKEQLAKTTTDSKILEQLSHDEYSWVRYNVAENPNTSAETLEFLSRDYDYRVRYNVAENPNTSAETLEFFSCDKFWTVRCCVARNPNTPFETLKQMAIHDEYDLVRDWILQHPNCNNDLYMYIEGRKLLETLSKLSIKNG